MPNSKQTSELNTIEFKDKFTRLPSDKILNVNELAGGGIGFVIHNEKERIGVVCISKENKEALINFLTREQN